MGQPNTHLLAVKYAPNGLPHAHMSIWDREIRGTESKSLTRTPSHPLTLARTHHTQHSPSEQLRRLHVHQSEQQDSAEDGTDSQQSQDARLQQADEKERNTHERELRPEEQEQHQAQDPAVSRGPALTPATPSPDVQHGRAVSFAPSQGGRGGDSARRGGGDGWEGVGAGDGGAGDDGAGSHGVRGGRRSWERGVEGEGGGKEGGGMPATPPKVREVMSKIDSFLAHRRAQRVPSAAHRSCVSLSCSALAVYVFMCAYSGCVNTVGSVCANND
jgi:hypothetical protein